MCGISGIFSDRFIPSPAKNIAAMTDLIQHRGPNGQGYALFSDAGSFIFSDQEGPLSSAAPYHLSAADCVRTSDHSANVALGHRRLSIIDLSTAGCQPMSSDDGRYTITYNGEIYNYLELREELEAKSHTFHSKTDTEVLLNAFIEWDAACLDRFNGMFAFVIYDRVTKRIFAARDRFGIKPLYYWLSPQGFWAVASEIKQFTVLPGWEARLNVARGYDFLVAKLGDHTRETMFDKVYQLDRGHYIDALLSDSFEQVNKTVCWYHATIQTNKKLSLDSAKARFRELFEDSVKLRMRADVPIGTTLSGGLDSSSIVCLMNDLLRKHDSHDLQNVFSAYANHKQYDEREYIQEVVRKTKVKAHHVIPDANNLFLNLPKLTWTQDEPFSSTSIYAQHAVFDLVSKNDVRVNLDGQGADEILGGYNTFHSFYIRELFKSGRWFKLFSEAKELKAAFGYNNKYFLDSLIPALPRSAYKLLLSLKKPQTSMLEFLNKQLLPFSKAYSPYHKFNPPTMSLSEFSRAQLFNTVMPFQLHWSDRNSMAFSIENRVPFLDHRLVEFALNLPTTLRLRGSTTKYLLRESLKDTLPEKIYNRKDKLGFATPEAIWAKKEAAHLFLKGIDHAIEQSNGLLSPQLKDRAVQVFKGSEPYNNFFWRAISFGAWIDKFKVCV